MLPACATRMTVIAHCDDLETTRESLSSQSGHAAAQMHYKTRTFHVGRAPHGRVLPRFGQSSTARGLVGLHRRVQFRVFEASLRRTAMLARACRGHPRSSRRQAGLAPRRQPLGSSLADREAMKVNVGAHGEALESVALLIFERQTSMRRTAMLARACRGHPRSSRRQAGLAPRRQPLGSSLADREAMKVNVGAHGEALESVALLIFERQTSLRRTAMLARACRGLPQACRGLDHPRGVVLDSF